MSASIKTGNRKAVPAGLVAVMFLAALLLPLNAKASGDALVILDNGAVGLGVDNPARQLHLQGNNAAFRMDRDANSAAFILTRTARRDFNNILKTFVVGVNAQDVNNGEFIINDLGSAVSGAGTRRMTINNAGNVIFTGEVTSSSSIRYKDDVRTLTGVEEALQQLRGVRFVRRDNGRPGLGLIAEEVAEIYPELIERDSASGEIEAVNYGALVAVLIEGYKEQQQQLEAQHQQIAAYRSRVEELAQQQAALQAQQSELAALRTQVAAIERLLAGDLPALAQR